MKIQREWATPLAAGAFLLSAVTGVLIFFHVDGGLNKAAHEWLSWILLVGVVAHLVANFAAFRRHLTARRGQLLMGGFAVLLLVSFVDLGGGNSEPPFAPPVRALAALPLTRLAEVAGLTLPQLQQRLGRAGLPAAGAEQSLRDLAGPDLRRQMRVLGSVLAAG